MFASEPTRAGFMPNLRLLGLAPRRNAMEWRTRPIRPESLHSRGGRIIAMRVSAQLILALLLSACASDRPITATCPAATGEPPQPFDAALDAAVASRWQGPPDGKRHPIAVLVLSGGGAWGAYGAGFLNGWTQRPANTTDRWPSRPTFDVVTGVSTGAIIAPFALVGSAGDAFLQHAFRGVGGKDLYSGNGLMGLLGGHSLKKPDGIERSLVAGLDDSTIAAIKTAYTDKRSAWVGAVNFDTGDFTEFNLSAIASALPIDQAREQITDHIMAASAVPGFFPPRFINGCMYMDGGVRQNVFITSVQTAANASGQEQSRANIYVIVNDVTEVPSELTKYSVREIATRSYALIENQSEINSLRNIYQYAHEHGYGFYWTTADDVVFYANVAGNHGAACEAPKTPAGQFEATFTACLYDAALHKARDGATAWRTDRP
jgi:predicted acylesterase/phospholipase RssA